MVSEFFKLIATILHINLAQPSEPSKTVSPDRIPQWESNYMNPRVGCQPQAIKYRVCSSGSRLTIV
jgi:hypothetical protein